MVDRVVIGRHPVYASTGVYISQPGLNVAAYNPASKTGLVLSSDWPQIACVVASGICSLGAFVPYPSAASGFLPYVMFNRLIASGYDTHETYVGMTQIDRGGPFTTQEEHRSRWRCAQDWSGFTIVRSSGAYADSGNADAVFRYVLFNMSVSG
jgi:hypothetical protein